MDNHYHLLVETPDGNLSKGMRQLNGVYTLVDEAGIIFDFHYKGKCRVIG